MDMHEQMGVHNYYKLELYSTLLFKSLESVSFFMFLKKVL